MAIAGWPVAADYDEAIQNPHLNFDDPELKAGEPESDKYGSPLVRSGNFASVYLLIGTRRKAAVRCFLRDVADQQDRYAAIGHDLLSLSLPYTVDFEFVPKGIKVQGSWFPILKMDWCDGELLDRYIEKNLDNPLKLRRLADKWFEMTVTLRKEGIAHGDLQHGNIFVANDEIKLIDYDGMFVPRLAGRQSNERGLEHYQSPKRDDSHFGRYLDNFSNWVIYTTLYALSVDPSLWRFVNLPDKHLLFKKSDYEDVANSPTFKALLEHEDGTVRTYATTVQNLLLYDVPRIPDFNPDKPVLYPPTKPQINARSDRGDLYSSSDRAKAVDGDGDRGRLYEQDTGGDRGRLYEQDTGGDRGNLAEKEAAGDRGGLLDKGAADTAVQVIEKPKEEKKKPLSKEMIGAIAGVLLFVVGGLIFAFTSFSSNQAAAYEKQLKEGITAARNDRPGEAAEAFSKVAANPNAGVSARTTAKCLAALSELQDKKPAATMDDMRRAQAKIETALMDDPNNASVLYALGKLCENMNDRPKALKYYLDAVSADPSDKEFKAAAQKLQK